MTKNEIIIAMLERAHSFCAGFEDFDVIIEGYDTEEGFFYGIDMDGNEYHITFDEVDLKCDRFYELRAIDIPVDIPE